MINKLLLTILAFFAFNCTSKNQPSSGEPIQTRTLQNNQELNVVYNSYENLVLAGYQGWFAAKGDESNRGWYHYGSRGGFEPGKSSIDMWPDMTEYTKKYVTSFKFADGSPAYLPSSYDAETTDLHFKWMKEYGLDGVHMQRFLVEVKSKRKNGGKRHFNEVLKNALTSAKKHNRAISLMYDLSGSNGESLMSLKDDLNELKETHQLFNTEVNPTYLHHNGKPLVSIWGVGFGGGREYDIADVAKLVEALQSDENPPAIMLGVPYYWRELGRDTSEDSALHDLIKKVDIIMPWAVGRYNIKNLDPSVVKEDVKWAIENNVTYIPLVYPGFSWGNMHFDTKKYDEIPRLEGDFLWKQISNAKTGGAKALYVAMFDEIDEATAIFKVLNEDKTPLNGDNGYRFIGVENDLDSDYYLWLTGQGTSWFHNEGNYSSVKPVR